MAAGQGFKTFVTGEVLTAGDVNGYLMQGINVFTNATARDAAITAPAEGQFAFTKDNNSLWYYDGAAWVASGATGDIEGVTAGVGISGGGTSGTVTVTNSMATAIDAKGDLVPGTGADTFARLAVGANDTVLTADSSTATGLKWAAPAAAGITLKGYKGPTNTTSITAGKQASFNKLNGYYIITTSNGFIFYSSDCKTWTRWASTGTENSITLYAAAYGAGVWVFVGDSGNLWTASTIGGTLTSRTSGFGGETIPNVCFTAGSINLFTIVGGNGLTASSSNGTTWTLRTANQGTNNLSNLATDGTSTIILGGGSGTNNVSYSTNGTTWTSVSPDAGGNEASKSLYWDPTNEYFVNQVNTSSAYYVAKANVASTWTLLDQTPIGVFQGGLSDLTSYGTQYRIYDASRSSFYTCSIVAGNIILTEWDLTQTSQPRSGYIAYQIKNVYTLSAPESATSIASQSQIGWGFADGVHNFASSQMAWMLSNAV